MALPFPAPIAPMLAKRASTIPEGDLLFEPKWDGFRTLVFRDGSDLHLQSRDGKPMLRYFPELEAPLLAGLPERCVLDGELVIATERGLDFDALQLRIHPAASRVELLSVDTPARFVAFDLLALGDDDLRQEPFRDRRARLEGLLADAAPPLHLTPATLDRAVATDWFHRFEGAGFDGVMAKGLADTYQAGKRVMFKVKHERTCECAVAGFRWHKDGPPHVGSLILGLFDAEGRMHQVGVAASFTAKRRASLLDELAPLRDDPLRDHPWREWMEGAERRPGVQSRWSRGRDLSWEPLRLECVAEVRYNHLAGGRFRHPVKMVRWRHDKRPEECTYDQVDSAPPTELGAIFGL